MHCHWITRSLDRLALGRNDSPTAGCLALLQGTLSAWTKETNAEPNQHRNCQKGKGLTALVCLGSSFEQAMRKYLEHLLQWTWQVVPSIATHNQPTYWPTNQPSSQPSIIQSSEQPAKTPNSLDALSSQRTKHQWHVTCLWVELITTHISMHYWVSFRDPLDALVNYGTVVTNAGFPVLWPLLCWGCGYVRQK